MADADGCPATRGAASGLSDFKLGARTGPLAAVIRTLLRPPIAADLGKRRTEVRVVGCVTGSRPPEISSALLIASGSVALVGW
jgi:hypothetical protein